MLLMYVHVLVMIPDQYYYVCMNVLLPVAVAVDDYLPSTTAVLE